MKVLVQHFFLLVLVLGYANGQCSPNCDTVTGDDCDLNGVCVKCKDNNWGPSFCEGTCASGCDSVTGNNCARNTGVCARCRDNNWGTEICDKTCAPGCDSVTGNNCDRDSGECVHCRDNNWGTEICDKTCAEGCDSVTGNNCDRDSGVCVRCRDHLWGTETCDKTCADGCDSVTGNNCDRDTGVCVRCKDNRWGKNTCGKTCASGCDSVTGNNCDRDSGVCQRCRDNNWGTQFCDKVCSTECESVSGNNCNRDTGHCVRCKNGQVGAQCNLPSEAEAGMDCGEPDGKCAFYSSCMEAARICGSEGYALAFGQKYCKKYKDNIADFSSKGKKWINAVAACLQKQVVSFFDSTPNKQSCATLQSKAFKSHAKCYITPDPSKPSISVCKLQCSDILRSASVISSAVLSHPGVIFGQLIDVARGCDSGICGLSSVLAFFGLGNKRDVEALPAKFTAKMIAAAISWPKAGILVEEVKAGTYQIAVLPTGSRTKAEAKAAAESLRNMLRDGTLDDDVPTADSAKVCPKKGCLAVSHKDATLREPSKPKGLKIPNSSLKKKTLVVKWNSANDAEGGNVDSFVLQQKQGNKNWKTVGNPAGSKVSHQVKDLKPATKYCYRLKAVNVAAGDSDWSNKVCATTKA